jgi:hypothetical protein
MMDGPAGLSSIRDICMPAITAMRARMLAMNAILSAVLPRKRAAAAGIISSPAIKRTPTNFIETAIIRARSNVRNRFSRLGNSPLAWASSALTVLVSNACHLQMRHPRIKKTPAQIIITSERVTAKI